MAAKPILAQPPATGKPGTLIRGLKSARVHLAHGVIGGGVHMALSSMIPHNSETADPIVEETPGTMPPVETLVPGAIIVPTDKVHNVDYEEISFEEAFAEAREAAGPGHIFFWHGMAYSTYTAEEVRSLSADEQDEIRNTYVEEVDEEEIDTDTVNETELLGDFGEAGEEDPDDGEPQEEVQEEEEVDDEDENENTIAGTEGFNEGDTEEELPEELPVVEGEPEEEEIMEEEVPEVIAEAEETGGFAAAGEDDLEEIPEVLGEQELETTLGFTDMQQDQEILIEEELDPENENSNS